MNTTQFDDVVDAVLIWTGWGKFTSPQRDYSLFASHVGDEEASRLHPLVKRLKEDFYLSDAWKTTADLNEMGEMASEQFRTKYPGIPDQMRKRSFVTLFLLPGISATRT